MAGISIGTKDYADPVYQADMARADLVILGFYKGWTSATLGMRDVVKALKALNPNLLLGQYSSLAEQPDSPDPTNPDYDVYDKLETLSWWARDAAGNRVQASATSSTWAINITSWVKPDPNGKRWPAWYAARTSGAFFDKVPEFDVWYHGGFFTKPRVTADWNLDNIDDSPDDPAIQSEHRKAHAAEVMEGRSLHPALYHIGNVQTLDSPEYKGLLDGAFLAALIGMPYSLETTGTWASMMANYRGAMANTTDAHLVMFDVQGAVDDYALVRYGLTSCLMDDGYFVFTDDAVGYASVPRFDELQVALGKALDPPPSAAWQKGVYRRRFEKGVAIVNPKGNGAQTVTLEAGVYKKLKGLQAPTVNDGSPVDGLTVPERDGIVLVLR